MSSLVAYIIGNRRRAEFLLLADKLEILLRQNHWNYSSHAQLPVISPDVELLILLQSYAGECSATILRDIKKTAPLAPVILIAGTSAEGEARTGTSPAGTFRLYAHQWNHEFDSEFQRFLQNKTSVFAQPPTTENDELVLKYFPFHANSPSESLEKNKIEKMECFVLSHIGPFGNDVQMNRMLATCFQKRGYVVSAGSGTPQIPFSGALLADADDSPFYEIRKGIQRLRQQFADADIKVYINSPRINEINDLLKAGANEILTKPMFW